MRQRRYQPRVIAYAVPQQNRQQRALWAAGAGLMTSIAIYAIACILGA